MKIEAFAILFLAVTMTANLTAQNNSSIRDFEGDRRIDMWEEPRHQLVFARDQLKVMDVRVPPGDTSQFHQHRFATIYIVINDALMWGQGDGEVWKSSRSILREKYSISDRSTAYFENHTYHRVCNPDTATLHLIALLNTKGPTDDVYAKTEGVDNRWFRETRLHLAGHEKSRVLEFPYPTVLVQCGLGESAVLQAKVEHSAKTEEGAFSWHAADVPFSVVNKSGGLQEFVLVEVGSTQLLLCTIDMPWFESFALVST